MAPEVQRKNALVSTTRAFTLLELVVALVIIGILGTIVAPNLGRLRPGYQRDEFISNIRALVRRGWQESLQNHQLHRIYFDLEKRVARLERDTGKKTGTGEMAWEPLSSVFMISAFEWPSTMEMKDFYIDGEDVFHIRGIRTTFIWFCIFPDGTAQNIIMNWFDQSDTRESEAGSRFSVAVSPFIAKVAETNGFQKPA